ncbi:hypothetical protein CAPTEDRAFT_219591 [Capitella teleta]|uniref:Nuclear transcription factor Y subunit n=1 Tax=Capitella teleta TaxID=283909 RepID=R7UDT0_CAPTE|nr:hypothetical protein CAPTEDRAFT_219591 [Capitella teleta]|eukprot:ELU04149.1 hypothetical protein CAPTEDRAFT_219591 [Capitella teleta]
MLEMRSTQKSIDVPPPQMTALSLVQIPATLDPSRMQQEVALAEGAGERVAYVNPKQYNRILKRRQARAKLEAGGKIPPARQKYLHESRRQHALKRVRASGGKFAKSANCDRLTADKENSIADLRSLSPHQF